MPVALVVLVLGITSGYGDIGYRKLSLLPCLLSATLFLKRLHHAPPATSDQRPDNIILALFKGCAAIAAAISLSGCFLAPVAILGAYGGATVTNSDTETLTTKTADYFSTKPGNIKITDIKKIANMVGGTTYKATYKGVIYNCTYMAFTELSCMKPGGQPFQ